MELKCKLCGGNIHFGEGDYCTTCEYCGVSQFIFDYLDKDSEDYEEQVEIIKEEKELFEKTYFEYADDVLNADGYCLTSNDFKKIIDFFEKCIDYGEARSLLPIAKTEFIRRVASSSDCALALKYVDELPDLSDDARATLQKSLNDMSGICLIDELKERGYVATLFSVHSAENLLDVMKKAVSAKEKDTDILTEREKEIVSDYLGATEEYIEKYLTEAVRECADINILNEIKSFIPTVKNTFPELRLSDAEDTLTKTIERVNATIRVIEEQLIENKRQEQRKKKITKIGIIAIVCLVILGIVGAIIHNVNGYSAENVSIEVLSKSNLEYSRSTYYYMFEFELSNDSPHDIELVRGTFEIVNKEGRTLSSSSLEMHCDLKADSSEMQNIRLSISEGKDAVELWESDLEDLTIKFRIKTIRFEDGTYKNYSNTKNKIIYGR